MSKILLKIHRYLFKVIANGNEDVLWKDKSMKMKYRVISIILLVLLVIPGITGTVYADSDHFKVEVESSKNPDGETYNVSMNVTNLGSDFKGTIRFVTKGTNYSSLVGFDSDISIAAGSTKEYTVRVPENYILPKETTKVVILDQKEKEVYSRDFKSVFSSSSGTISQGILSDHPEKLTVLDLGGTSVELDGEKFTVKQRELDGSSISNELNSLDMLVIDDFDTSTLSEECIQGIMTWVNRGGMLVIGSGKGAERTISGFDDGAMFDIEFQMNSSVESQLFNVGPYYEMDSTFYIYGTSYSYCSMDYMRVLEYGQGTISVLAYSMSEFENEKTYRIDALQAVYTEAYGRTSKSTGESSDSVTENELSDILAYMEKPAKTGKALLSVIIIVYTVLIGPGIYLILKAVKQREKIWVVIPIISLVFVGLIFLVSLSIRINEKVVRSVNIVKLGSKKVDTFVFGYAPGTSKWNVEVDGQYTYGTSMSGYRYDDMIGGSVNIKNEKAVLNSYPDGTFEVKAFCLSQPYTENESIDGVSDGGVGGVVTNNTSVSFDYMVITSQNGSQIVENVKPGDTIKINLTLASNYGYTGRDYMLQNECTPVYKNKEYEKAAEYAAMAIALDRELGDRISVVGVTKSEGITGKKEQSWTCYTNK